MIHPNNGDLPLFCEGLGKGDARPEAGLKPGANRYGDSVNSWFFF